MADAMRFPTLRLVLLCLSIIGAAWQAPAHAATFIPVEFAADRIFQRVGTEKAIRFATAYSGSPCGIDIQIVDATSGAVRVPWTSLSGQPGGGTADGTVSVPQYLGWYKWQVRDHCDLGSAPATSRNRFGVGADILLAGQSNITALFYFANTNGPAAPPTPSQFARRYAGNGWFAVEAPFQPGEIPSTFSGNMNGGWGAQTLAADFVAALGVNVGLLEYAVGASFSAQWAPSGNLYRQMIGPGGAPPHGLTFPDVGSDCELVIFGQGEQDAIYAGKKPAAFNGSVWTNNIAGMYAGLEKATRPGLPMAIQLLGWNGQDGYSGNDAGFDVIRRAQLSFIAAHAPAVYLSASAMDASLDPSSKLHYAVPTYYRLAARHAQAYKHHLGKAATGGTGPVLRGARWSPGAPDRLTLDIAPDPGARLEDGAGGTGQRLNGFRVFNGDAPLAIRATAIAGDTVVLTLAAAIPAGDVASGRVKLDYEYGENPHGFQTPPDLANYVFDTAIPAGDTIGLPMQPTNGPMTVTGR